MVFTLPPVAGGFKRLNPRATSSALWNGLWTLERGKEEVNPWATVHRQSHPDT